METKVMDGSPQKTPKDQLIGQEEDPRQRSIVAIYEIACIFLVVVVKEDKETHWKDKNNKEDQNRASKEELINPDKAKEDVDLVEGEIGKIPNILFQKDLEHGPHNERVSPEKYTNF